MDFKSDVKRALGQVIVDAGRLVESLEYTSDLGKQWVDDNYNYFLATLSILKEKMEMWKREEITSQIKTCFDEEPE